MESVFGRYRNLTILVGILFLQVLGLAIQVKRAHRKARGDDVAAHVTAHAAQADEGDAADRVGDAHASEIHVVGLKLTTMLNRALQGDEYVEGSEPTDEDIQSINIDPALFKSGKARRVKFKGVDEFPPPGMLYRAKEGGCPACLGWPGRGCIPATAPSSRGAG